MLYANGSLVTLTAPSSAEQSTTTLLQPTATPITANASSLQAQGTSSNPFVSAQVVNGTQNVPISPNSNSSFLLVTFGSTNTSTSSVTDSSATQTPQRKEKRQASSQPLVYNATQSFSAVSGGIYNLSANAADAQNGDTAPDCALTICGDDICGSSQPISTTFEVYSYQFTEPTTESAVATFSISCVGQAYVGLDNVTVTPIYIPPSAASSSAAGTGSSSLSSTVASSLSSGSRRGSVQTVTTSIYLTTTAYATQTTTQLTTSVAYDTYTTTAYQSLTATLNATTTQYTTLPASTYITSELVTTTYLTSELVTTTLPASTQFQNVTLYQNLTVTWVLRRNALGQPSHHKWMELTIIPF